MTRKSEIGKKGEDLAASYLISKGYKIIERNFRKAWGELDIIAIDKKGILVFIEVKAMRQQIAGLSPEDNLTKAKLIKLKRTASMYVGFQENLVKESAWQIDLVAIDFSNEGNHRIRHYENI